MGRLKSERPSPHPYVALAKRAVRLTASRVDPFLYIDRSEYCTIPEMTVRRGCFVSIKKAPLGELRGCIGTIRPLRKYLWQEIVANARAAASEDPRFPPSSPLKRRNVSFQLMFWMNPPRSGISPTLIPSFMG